MKRTNWNFRGGLHRLLCQPANFVICPSYKLTYTRTFSNKQGSGAKSKSKSKIKNSGVRGSGKKCSLKGKERNILQYIEMRINYWFSNENLADDNYMRKKMLENGGWMSLKDLCSFPLFKKEKIGQETIVKALANSSHLELGCPREGNAITSMRRIDLDLSSASTWEDISNKKSEKVKQRNVFRSLAKYNHGRKVHISNTIKKVNTAMKRIQEEAYKNENKHGGAVISFDVENATIVHGIMNGGPKKNPHRGPPVFDLGQSPGAARAARSRGSQPRGARDQAGSLQHQATPTAPRSRDLH